MYNDSLNLSKLSSNTADALGAKIAAAELALETEAVSANAAAAIATVVP